MCSLRLRKTTESDFAVIYSWYTEPGIADRALCIVESNYADFAHHYAGLIGSDNAQCWVICHGDQRVGVAEIRSIGEYSGCYQGEAVLWLGQQRGKGIGISVIGCLLRQAFDVLRLDRLWWWVAKENRSMIRICTKLGFSLLEGDQGSMRDRVFFQADESSYKIFAERSEGWHHLPAW
jgi:RimJ/RimL family protein N-acetyltransferase